MAEPTRGTRTANTPTLKEKAGRYEEAYRLPQLAACEGCDALDIDLIRLRRYKVLRDLEQRGGFLGKISNPTSGRSAIRQRLESCPPPGARHDGATVSVDTQPFAFWLRLLRDSPDPLRTERIIAVIRGRLAPPARSSRDERDKRLADGEYAGLLRAEIAHIEGVGEEALRGRRDMVTAVA